MIVDPQSDLPGFEDVAEAAARLQDVAVHTPLLRCDHIDHIAGRPLWFKAECLQRTGSFKIRGAWNRCSHIDAEVLPRGVVAFSSGNHAQGVAASAKLLDIPSTIVMPSDAPSAKREATVAYGAKVVLYDRLRESREAIGDAISIETGATLIRPFDDAWVVAGQATATLEAIRDASRRNVEFDAMICTASGGGLLAGAAIVLTELSPKTALLVAEPAGHDDHLRSLDQGKLVENDTGVRSIADALLAPRPGSLTFRINRDKVKGGYTVSDSQIYGAMESAFRDLKVVLEPGGAVAFAAALAHAAEAPGDGPLLIMLSGGNVDKTVFNRALEERVGRSAA